MSEQEVEEASVSRLQEALRKIPPEQQPMTITVKLPTGTEIYANDIRRFVDAMVYKLGIHRNKGRWEDLPIDRAMGQLFGEFRELAEAVKGGNTVETILEAADVANYAMIVASIIMDSGNETSERV